MILFNNGYTILLFEYLSDCLGVGPRFAAVPPRLSESQSSSPVLASLGTSNSPSLGVLLGVSQSAVSQRGDTTPKSARVVSNVKGFQCSTVEPDQHWVSKLCCFTSGRPKQPCCCLYYSAVVLVSPYRPNQGSGLCSLPCPFCICHRHPALGLGLAFRAPAVLVLRLCWRVQHALQTTTVVGATKLFEYIPLRRQNRGV
jgi:hypothetical protein